MMSGKQKILLSIVGIWMFQFLGMEALYAQFIQNSSKSLFSDVKAFKPGDAIMVLIMEDTQAGNSASTSDSRSTDLSATINGTSGSNSTQIVGGLNTGTKFSGTGSTQRSESIKSQLSARVVSVDSLSGNLVLEGRRTTKINGETQTILIKGIVRPVDVMPNNSVYSYSILDLTLMIEGDGSVSKIQEPGLITKFLRFLF
jgi:flagellar L-ring protein FlgH